MTDISTINNIKTTCDTIKESIKTIEFKIGSFGNEAEYTHKGLIGGLKSLLIDVNTLCKNQTKFIQLTNYNERTTILNTLSHINSYLIEPQYLFGYVEELKILMRNLGVRNFSERQLEFETECQNVLKLKIQIEDELKEIRKIKAKIVTEEKKVKQNSDNYDLNSNKIISEIEAIVENKTKLINQSSKLQSVLDSSIELESNIKEQAKKVNESTSNVKANEKLIDSFAQKIQDRESRLDEVEKNIDLQKTKLEEYNTTRESFLKQAEELIENAKQALNYTTAEGISASFKTRFDEASNPNRYGWWIFSAICCISAAIGLGIWVVVSDSETGLIIGRISLIPLPIVGAIFCARQYTKQKNIIEDYAYKMVLAKAIVGFSEQLKKHGSSDNSEYVHYIKTSLEEIHKDPLRKRDKENSSNELSLDGIIEIAEKLKKITKIENPNG